MIIVCIKKNRRLNGTHSECDFRYDPTARNSERVKITRSDNGTMGDLDFEKCVKNNWRIGKRNFQIRKMREYYS